MGRVTDFDHFKVGRIWILPLGTAIRWGFLRIELGRLRIIKRRICAKVIQIFKPSIMICTAPLGMGVGG